MSARRYFLLNLPLCLSHVPVANSGSQMFLFFHGSMRIGVPAYSSLPACVRNASQNICLALASRRPYLE